MESSEVKDPLTKSSARTNDAQTTETSSTSPGRALSPQASVETLPGPARVANSQTPGTITPSYIYALG